MAQAKVMQLAVLTSRKFTNRQERHFEAWKTQVEVETLATSIQQLSREFYTQHKEFLRTFEGYKQTL